MTAILVRRLVRLIVICFGISLITFLLMHLSGDPVAMILPEATEADRAVLREAMGFNRPLLVQYGSFMVRAVQGDFGQSLYHRSPALPLVLERMPTTLLLTLFALLLAVVIAIPAGIFTAVKRYSVYDHLATVAVLLGQSMPVFWTGIMLILLFAVGLNLLPGVRLGVMAGDGAPHLDARDLPGTVVPAHVALSHARCSRARLCPDGAGERLGRMAGDCETCPEECRHPDCHRDRPAIRRSLGGAVVTETVFAIPGTGRLIVGPSGSSTFPVVQAGVMMFSLIIVVVNFIVDLLYLYLNPQVRIS